MAANKRKRVTGDVHMDRYLRRSIGMTAEEIASQDNVKIETVKESIAQVDAYRASHTLDFATEAITSQIVDLAPHSVAVLKRGMQATETIRLGNGRWVKRADLDTQLKAQQQYTEMMAAIQPKGGKPVSVQVNATAQSGASAGSHSETRVMGYEEHLRNVRLRVAEEAKRQSEVGTTFDDEVLEAADDDEEADELPVLEAEHETA